MSRKLATFDRILLGLLVPVLVPLRGDLAGGSHAHTLLVVAVVDEGGAELGVEVRGDSKIRDRSIFVGLLGARGELDHDPAVLVRADSADAIGGLDVLARAEQGRRHFGHTFRGGVFVHLFPATSRDADR